MQEGKIMHRFYVDTNQISETDIIVTGSDLNHMKNVLRMRIDEAVVICDGQGTDYHCKIRSYENDSAYLDIIEKDETNTELGTKLYLFQGMPKKDKMELIVQKAVELGAYEVIPVMMKRTIVKLEDKKKEAKKIERWQSIATSAAKQSNRGYIPRVHEVVSYKEALQMASELDMVLLPYENDKGMSHTKELIKSAKNKKSIGIFIGPEGGYEESEIAQAVEMNMEPITLGKRILRTETAGLTTLSLLMFELEE